MLYKISQVALMLGVSTQSLRNWEANGYIPKSHRRPTKHREYTDEDVKAIQEFLDKRNKN